MSAPRRPDEPNPRKTRQARSIELRRVPVSPPAPIDEALARALVEHASDVILLLDAELVIRFVTPSVARVLGYDAGALLGASLAELVHPSDVPLARGFFAEALAEPDVTPAVEWRLRARDGRWLSFENVATPLLDHPAVNGIVLASRDVSERARLVTQLEHLAFHDPLTNLPNRALFRDRVEQALARSDRYGRGVAVLFLDLDHFKNVNDSLGHEAGDRLLTEVAERLVNCIRRIDTACRLGGDEFSVLLEGVANDEDLLDVPHRVLEALAQPITIAGKEFVVGASVGIARAEPGATADDVLRNADVAMYHAKSRGRGVCQVFEPYMHEAAVERLTLEGDLRRALACGEFHVDFQPIVELETSRIVGVETLLRWAHPTRGAVSPARFIPLAEETGLIVDIGRWVLEAACAQAATWQRKGLGALLLTVNVSARQFLHRELFDVVVSALERSRLPPAQLGLEITESMLIQQADEVTDALTRLDGLGVKLAIDDFGTGFSSLTYLKRFPVRDIKIDQSFVRNIPADADDVAIVRAIIAMARSLGISVTAEGVETLEQLELLQELGCDAYQGYLFSRPVPAQAFEDLVRGQAEG